MKLNEDLLSDEYWNSLEEQLKTIQEKIDLQELNKPSIALGNYAGKCGGGMSNRYSYENYIKAIQEDIDNGLRCEKCGKLFKFDYEDETCKCVDR